MNRTPLQARVFDPWFQRLFAGLDEMIVVHSRIEAGRKRIVDPGLQRVAEFVFLQARVDSTAVIQRLIESGIGKRVIVQARIFQPRLKRLLEAWIERFFESGIVEFIFEPRIESPPVIFERVLESRIGEFIILRGGLNTRLERLEFRAGEWLISQIGIDFPAQPLFFRQGIFVDNQESARPILCVLQLFDPRGVDPFSRREKGRPKKEYGEEEPNAEAGRSERFLRSFFPDRIKIISSSARFSPTPINDLVVYIVI
ncbi:MAG: hypothetical protein LLH30_07180 [Candidatus Manganitrophus sp. SA1]|nr:hypothetical protein [Candidatus Manganitrophus morganii]